MGIVQLQSQIGIFCFLISSQTKIKYYRSSDSLIKIIEILPPKVEHCTEYEAVKYLYKANVTKVFLPTGCKCLGRARCKSF